MTKLVRLGLSALAGAGLALLLAGPASSASCALGGGLTGACAVTGGSPAGTIDYGADIDLTGGLLTPSAGVQLISSGDFQVAPGVPGATGVVVNLDIGKFTGFKSLFLELFSDSLFTSSIAGPIDIRALAISAGSVLVTLAQPTTWYKFTGEAVVKAGDRADYDVSLSAVPLPPALMLFGTALAGMRLLRRRRTA